MGSQLLKDMQRDIAEGAGLLGEPSEEGTEGGSRALAAGQAKAADGNDRSGDAHREAAVERQSKRPRTASASDLFLQKQLQREQSSGGGGPEIPTAPLPPILGRTVLYLYLIEARRRPTRVPAVHAAYARSLPAAFNLPISWRPVRALGLPHPAAISCHTIHLFSSHADVPLLRPAMPPSHTKRPECSLLLLYMILSRDPFRRSFERSRAHVPGVKRRS